VRTAFINTLIELARTDERIFLLVGDLGYSVVEPFAQEFPNRFINVGVAEQNMIGVATGLALCGKIVFAYSIVNFPTLRCLEQIRNDVCYHNANVRIVAVGGGLAYGSLGMTHHGTEDVAIMAALANMTVIAPRDPVETALAVRASLGWKGPCYIRLSRGGDAVIHQTPPIFRIGKAISIRNGKDVTLIATGAIVQNALKAADQLAEEGIDARVLSMHTIKPLDVDAVLSSALETGAIVTIEEHKTNGLGNAVANVLGTSLGSECPPLLTLGLTDEFPKETGSHRYLLQTAGLSTESIKRSVERFVLGLMRA